MEGDLWLGILMAILASLGLNVGKGVQKWKVRIFAKKMDMFKSGNRGDLGIWLIGFALTAAATPLYSLALNYTDKSSMVSSFNGVGMIGLVVFAWLVLGERIGWREIAGAALVLVGAAVMKYFDEPSPQRGFSVLRFATAAGTLLAFFSAMAAWSWAAKRVHGFSFGAVAGILIGIAMILGDMALVTSKGDMLGQLKNPYPYIAVLSGTLALIVTQFAFWRARAMVVVPTINSFIIVSPAIIEYFTFGTILKPIQYLGIFAIIIGVILLTYTEKQDRIEAVEAGGA